MEKLAQLRQQIDDIDLQLLDLMNQRAKAAIEIGKAKQQQADSHTVFYRPEREALILKRLNDHNQGPLKSTEINFIFRSLLTACLSLQKPLSIAYLGPEGTYSQLALQQQFGTMTDQKPQGTIEEVFREVERGHVDYGVVPVENSSTGMINLTLDVLKHSTLKICGEIILPIHHSLLSSAESEKEIYYIYSHEQSLLQCQNWLAQNFPKAEKIPVKSNAEAAQRASKDPHAAAIASEQAADIYGLDILHRHIEDMSNNKTRFMILGRHGVGSSGQDKTSLLISSSHKPGVLYHLLQAFAEHQVNLCQISSRPSPEQQWAYIFYIDVEGHQDDQNIQQAILDLEKQAISVHVLGSYPRVGF